MKVIAIVRHVGERTHELVIDFCQRALKEENVFVIAHEPLSTSFRRCCEIAEETEADWVLLIGGDYIPREGFIEDFIEVAKKAKKKTMYVKGTIKDKYLGPLRAAGGGPMLHSGDSLRLVLGNYAAVDNGVTNEAQAHKFLEHKGWKGVRTDIYAGAHGFEQWNKDIYRSVFVYGRKRRDAFKLWGIWMSLSLSDPDYGVMAYAHQKGMDYKRSAVLADFREDYGFAESPYAKERKHLIKPEQYPELIASYNETSDPPYQL